MYDSKDLLSIGEMSRLCRIPVKTLRYFDKTGTVKPAFIDPSTQYRYYSKVQLPYIMFVKELKRSGYSLAFIREYSEISEADKHIVLVDAKLEQITKQIEKLQKYRQQYASCKNQLEFITNIKYGHVSVKYQPPRIVLFTRYRSKYEHFEVNVRFTELNHLMHDNNLFHNGPMFAVVHDDYRNFDPVDTDIEVGVQVSSRQASDYPFIREIPGGLYASINYEGSFETLIVEIYSVLYNWIREHNYQAIGPAIQVYLWVGPMGQAGDKLVTEIQIPVKIIK